MDSLSKDPIWPPRRPPSSQHTVDVYLAPLVNTIDSRVIILRQPNCTKFFQQHTREWNHPTISRYWNSLGTMGFDSFTSQATEQYSQSGVGPLPRRVVVKPLEKEIQAFDWLDALHIDHSIHRHFAMLCTDTPTYAIQFEVESTTQWCTCRYKYACSGLVCRILILTSQKRKRSDHACAVVPVAYQRHGQAKRQPSKPYSNLSTRPFYDSPESITGTLVTV